MKSISYTLALRLRDVSHNFSLQQVIVLSFIVEQPGFTAKEIVRFLDIPLTSMAQIIKSLVGYELVQKIQNNDDKRQFMLYPTEKTVLIYRFNN